MVAVLKDWSRRSRCSTAALDSESGIASNLRLILWLAALFQKKLAKNAPTMNADAGSTTCTLRNSHPSCNGVKMEPGKKTSMNIKVAADRSPTHMPLKAYTGTDCLLRRPSHTPASGDVAQMSAPRTRPKSSD